MNTRRPRCPNPGPLMALVLCSRMWLEVLPNSVVDDAKLCLHTTERKLYALKGEEISLALIKHLSVFVAFSSGKRPLHVHGQKSSPCWFLHIFSHYVKTSGTPYVQECHSACSAATFCSYCPGLGTKNQSISDVDLSLLKQKKIFNFNTRKRRDIYDGNFKNHRTNICCHDHFSLLARP